MGEQTIVFAGPGTWAAQKSCEAFLETRGFSIGRSQRGAPRGVLFGYFDIQKWRNLRPADREGLHAVVTGDGRDGPLQLTILAACPEDARELLLARPLSFALTPSDRREGL